MIIQRYLLREILLTLIAVTGVLYFVYVSNRFIRFLADVDSGGIVTELVLQLLALKSLSNLVMILPLGLFFAVLLAFGRLYKDHEMLALAACGVGTPRLLRIVASFALVFAAAVAALSFYFGPWADEQFYLIQDRAKAEAELQGIAAGRFRELRGSGLVFYVERLSADRLSMQNVFIQTRREGVLNIVTAARGHYHTDKASGDRYLVLQNGYRYEGQPGDAQFKIIEFREHGVLVQERAVFPSLRKLAALTSQELMARDDAAARAEFHWRLAHPLSALLLALLAVPMSRTTPRQGRFGRLFLAVLAYVVYSNLLTVGRAWIEKGTVPAELGLWWVHGALLLVIVVWLSRQGGWLAGGDRWFAARRVGKTAT